MRNPCLISENNEMWDRFLEWMCKDMIIEQSGHYIVKVKNSAGVQYAHMELLAGYETDSHSLFDSVHTGPHPDENAAWAAHQKLRETEK